MRQVFNRSEFEVFDPSKSYLVQIKEFDGKVKWFGCQFLSSDPSIGLNPVFKHNISGRIFHVHSEDITCVIELAFSEVKPAIPDSLLMSIFTENNGSFHPIELSNTKWCKPNKCHDWRNYIPDSVKEYWQQLDLISRCCLYLCAVKQANAEDWDE